MTLTAAQMLIQTQDEINDFIQEKNNFIKTNLPDIDITFYAMSRSLNMGIKDFDLIKSTIEEVVGVPDINKRLRKAELVKGREFMARIMRDNFPSISLKRIGQFYMRDQEINRGYDHSTVLNMLNQFETHIDTEHQYMNEWTEVHKQLEAKGVFLINRYQGIKKSN